MEHPNDIPMPWELSVSVRYYDVAYSMTVEQLYELFKERMLAEMAEEKRNDGKATD